MLRAQYSPQITDKTPEGKKTHAHKEGSLLIEKPGRGLTDKREEIAVWPERERVGVGARLSCSILLHPLREVLMHSVHCRFELFFLRISDLIGDVFSCVGRLKRVFFACSGKGVCRQYRPSPLCISCIYRLLASMAVLFQESSTLLYGLRCFLLVSKCVHLAMWLMICG